MIRKFFCFVILALMSMQLHLHAQDSLWVVQNNKQPFLKHIVNSGENIFMLGRRFAAPPAILADLNNKTYQDGLPTGSQITIPIGKYNYVRDSNCVKCKPLYYVVQEDETLHQIGRLIGITQSTLQSWNDLPLPDVRPGQTLLLGWMTYDEDQVPFSKKIKGDAPSLSEKKNILKNKNNPKDSILPIKNNKLDTLENDMGQYLEAKPSAFEQLYHEQATIGQVNEESGAIVFYNLNMQVESGTYYAMHKSAPKGSIVKIFNPASNKMIYAKIISQLPNISRYHNAILALSNNAIAALEAKDKRVFCKISYY